MAFDRGFHYGDGLFETIAILSPKFSKYYPLFSLHLNRLRLGLDKLRIALDWSTLLSDMEHYVDRVHKTQFDGSKWVLKVIITRGIGGRGYEPQTNQHPSIILLSYPFPTYPAHYQHEGIRIDFSDVTLPLDPYLAGIKHLNRLPQVLAAMALPAKSCHATEPCQELLLSDVTGHVIEGIKTNVFLLQDGQVKTPALSSSGVNGVMRQWIMQHVTVFEDQLTCDDFISAEEIFVCNSIIGIWPVKRIANHIKKVGEISINMQQLFQQMCHAST